MKGFDTSDDAFRNRSSVITCSPTMANIPRPLVSTVLVRVRSQRDLFAVSVYWWFIILTVCLLCP